MRRLVLVDRSSNRVCGDTSASGPHAKAWTKITAHFEDDIPSLAASAARLLDHSQGKMAQDYIFTPFVAEPDSDGYLIFDCSGCAAGPSDISDPSDSGEAIYRVMTKCFYIGYVRRDH